MSETTDGDVAVAKGGNTIPQPPRLRGIAEDDIQTVQAWVADLHRILAIEANTVGTQKVLLAAVNALRARAAALEADAATLAAAIVGLDARLDVHDADTVAFNALAYMPGSVSGVYVGAELAAAYTKINQIIAILRN